MITYPFGKTPEPGELIEVAPAVYWLRMPLPMSLNHINLYLLESGTGWTIIDTGIRGPETRSLWQQIADTHLKGGYRQFAATMIEFLVREYRYQ